jgi:predicted acylesterase/phospholipase RssA
MKKYKTLVLSGNSTNAVVILGTLQYLIDNSVLDEITTYVATSSGSLISLLLLIGYNPLEILTHLCATKVYETVPPLNMSNILLSGKPVMEFTPIKTCIEKMIINKIGHVPTLKSFSEYVKGKKIIFTVYNLTDHKREYLSEKTHPEVTISEAVQMSCNFPVIFSPYLYQNKHYIDGGLADSFPIEYALNNFNGPVLGIYIKNPLPNYDPENTTPLVTLDMLKIMFSIHTESVLEDKINRCSSLCNIIELQQKSNFFNSESKSEDLIILFDSGYDKGKKNWEQKQN